jgi:hypothetical protein
MNQHSFFETKNVLKFIKSLRCCCKITQFKAFRERLYETLIHDLFNRGGEDEPGGDVERR